MPISGPEEVIALRSYLHSANHIYHCEGDSTCNPVGVPRPSSNRHMKSRKSTMRPSKVAALALIVGAPSLMSGSLARTASHCSLSVTLADWGKNSNAYIDLKSGDTCLVPIRMGGTVSASDISQKPEHGKLKKLDTSTYRYEAKAKYKGSDTFAIKATGQGSTASGTSVITVHATIE